VRQNTAAADRRNIAIASKFTTNTSNARCVSMLNGSATAVPTAAAAAAARQPSRPAAAAAAMHAWRTTARSLHLSACSAGLAARSGNRLAPLTRALANDGSGAAQDPPAAAGEAAELPELVSWVLRRGGEVDGATLANLAGRDGGSGWGLKATRVRSISSPDGDAGKILEDGSAADRFQKGF